MSKGNKVVFIRSSKEHTIPRVCKLKKKPTLHRNVLAPEDKGEYICKHALAGFGDGSVAASSLSSSGPNFLC